MQKYFVWLSASLFSLVGHAESLDPAAAYHFLQQHNNAILVDVRDPIEVKFTGLATPTKILVPYKLVDVTRWDADSMTYAMKPNPAFEQQIASRLDARGVNKNDPILLMCRSGVRAEKAGEHLTALGYQRVIVIDNGFEGEVEDEEKASSAQRRKGWRYQGLPWSEKIPREVVWHP